MTERQPQVRIINCEERPAAFITIILNYILDYPQELDLESGTCIAFTLRFFYIPLKPHPFTPSQQLQLDVSNMWNRNFPVFWFRKRLASN